MENLFSVMLFDCLGVILVLVDREVNKIFLLEMDVNEWELFFMRCYILLVLFMNNCDLIGMNILECFMRILDLVRI